MKKIYVITKMEISITSPNGEVLKFTNKLFRNLWAVETKEAAETDIEQQKLNDKENGVVAYYDIEEITLFY